MMGLDRRAAEELWESQHDPLRLPVAPGPAGGRRAGVVGAADQRQATAASTPAATRDTGEVKKEFPPDVETYWFHHRCYIAKATENFLMPSRTGIEFVDPREGALGHQPLGARRLPLRGDAGQRPDLRAAAQLRLLSGGEALRIQRAGAGVDDVPTAGGDLRRGPARERAGLRPSALEGDGRRPTGRPTATTWHAAGHSAAVARRGPRAGVAGESRRPAQRADRA